MNTNDAQQLALGFFAGLALAGLIVVWLSRRPVPARETPVLALVTRRRELQSQLLSLVGCDLEAARLVRIEADRLQEPRSSLGALEAAIRRAELDQALERR